MKRKTLICLGINQNHAYAWSRTRMGSWAIAQSPILLTTITLKRLIKRGYESMLDYYKQVPPQLNEPLYAKLAFLNSPRCKRGLLEKIIGVESIEAAIEDARINAELNHKTNCEFYTGIIEKILDDDFINKHGKPEVIIADPSRAGMHPKVTEQILKILPDKIVYVSCNPATQARDVNLLSEKYGIKKSKAVDMFPHTTHVENVVMLKKV